MRSQNRWALTSEKSPAANSGRTVHDRSADMSNAPSRETFESMYAGKAPWDIGKRQPAFARGADRVRYGAGLAHLTRPGGRVFLMCFSDEEPGTQGPRRVSQQELRESFANGWAVEEIRPARFEVIPDLKDISFSEGGPKAWFSAI